MWGKEVSAMVRKEMKKEEKKHNFTCIPTNAGMAAAAGVGAKEKR